LQTSESSTKAAERRTGPRTKLVEIAYIGMGPENGGLVLDVSDGGLSFHAVAPVQPAEKIKFLLSLRGHSRIEGAGEVVWTNEMGTVCGMKFTSLSVGALEYLSNWTNQSRTAPVAKPVRPANTNGEKPTEPAANIVAAASAPATRNIFSAPSVLAITPAPQELPRESIVPSPWPTPMLFLATFGILTATIAITAFLIGIYVGKTEFKSVARPVTELNSQASPPITSEPSTAPLAETSDAQPSPESATSSPSAEAPVAARPNENPSKTAAVSGNAAQAPENGGTRPAARTSDGGESDLAAALAQLNGDNGNRDTSSAVRLLRAAAAKGNTTAEVTLADLYIYGDGVEKNCDQGRILLASAAKKGNAEAKVKLDELNAEGCP